MTSANQHLAAIVPKRATPLVVQHRPTPAPGRNELLIEVKAIALNPMDYMQRRMGMPPIKYPAILGSDIAGTITAVGEGVPANTPKAETRVAAYAQTFFKKGEPNYGALQTHVLVPAENVVPLPDSIGFNEASLLPMAVQTAWCGWTQIGLPLHTKAPPKRGVLVWGAGGSIGSAALQMAKTMGFTIYVTASAKHHAYLQSLGADQMFDYNDPDVVNKIIGAAEADGVTVAEAYLAVGKIQPCIRILQALKGAQQAKIALAPFQPLVLMWRIFPNFKNTMLKFVTVPANPVERTKFYQDAFGVWLKDKLASGEFKPSPKVEVLPGGLAAAEQGLFRFKDGVSGVKLVIEV